MPIINGILSLRENAPYEEITHDFYTSMLECVPPAGWHTPYDDEGWYICGEPYSHDFVTGEAYHVVCFNHNGKYYAGCRSLGTPREELEREIITFCRCYVHLQN